MAVMLMLAMTGGCVMHTLDAEKFEKLPHKLSRLYYTGTEGGFHYFKGSVFLGADRRYRVPASALIITNTFPRTSDRTQWIPWGQSFSGMEAGDLRAGVMGSRSNDTPREPINPLRNDNHRR